MNGGYLDINGAAKFLSVSSRTIRRNLDRIPHHRAPFGLRFTAEGLTEYMAAFSRDPIRAPKIDLDNILGKRRRERRSG